MASLPMPAYAYASQVVVESKNFDVDFKGEGGFVELKCGGL